MSQIDLDIKHIYKLILKKGFRIREQKNGEYLLTHPEDSLTMHITIGDRIEVSLYISEDDKYWKNYYKE